MTLVKTDRPRPIDRVIDYFGETCTTVATFRPASLEPAPRAGAAR